MCGIAGMAFADGAREPPRDLLEQMAEIVRHRGPDGCGVHRGAGVGLSIRRLAIVDLAAGDQPLASEDGSIVVVCNGEIYNAPELRQMLTARGHRFGTDSDVEPIVHLYEDHGPACVERLRGMFAFALWDARRRQLVLARDRFGIKPLHYAIDREGTCVFGSEQKSILLVRTVDRAPDPSAFRDLFAFGFVRRERTLFARIRRVPAAHYLVYRGGRLSRHRYWRLRFPERGERVVRRSAGEWAEALRAAFTDVVRQHLRSDVAVGAWLSGGLDSSAVAATMARLQRRPIRTFSLEFAQREFDEFHGQRTLESYPEFQLSGDRVVCPLDALGHLPDAVWHAEDPSLGGIYVVRMVLSRATARSLKVVLSGEGADEVLGGYDWFRLEKVMAPLRAVPVGLRRLVPQRLVRRRWPRVARLLLAADALQLHRYRSLLSPREGGSTAPLWSASWREQMHGVDDEDGDQEDDLPDGFERWDRFHQLQYFELTVRLPDLVVRHVDRASMAYGLEVRVPFLDHELVELCAAIPPSLKMRFLREKYVMRRAMDGVLPPEIAWRRKRGLQAPVHHWFRHDLPDFARDELAPPTIAARGIFDPALVRRLIDEHRARSANRGAELIGVLAVHLWDERLRQGRVASTVS